MSTVQNSQNVWPNLQKEKLDSKYEKCRNITEEIYKRINITFQIKKLETATQSDLSDYSDQIDSNELSNETDLFACEKSDSLSSSTEPEGAGTGVALDKYININNNEEPKKKAPGTVYKRPRKRFRKRVKKRPAQPQRRDSDGSSDEALPLSRIVDVEPRGGGEGGGGRSPDNEVGLPKIVIITKDMKPKIKSPEKKASEVEKKVEKQQTPKSETPEDQKTIAEPATNLQEDVKVKVGQPIDFSVKNTDAGHEATLDLTLVKGDEKYAPEWNCTLCSLSFRGERGLRRHMAISHVIHEDQKQPARPEHRDVKPV